MASACALVGPGACSAQGCGSDPPEVKSAVAAAHLCPLAQPEATAVAYDSDAPPTLCNGSSAPEVAAGFRGWTFSALAPNGQRLVLDSLDDRMRAMVGPEFESVPASVTADSLEGGEYLWLFNIDIQGFVAGGVRFENGRGWTEASGTAAITEIVLFSADAPRDLPAVADSLRHGVTLEPGGCDDITHAAAPTRAAWRDLEYAMATDTGEHLVVIDPEREFTDLKEGRYFVFFGYPPQVEQLASRGVHVDGAGTRHVAFLLRDGTEYLASFPSSCSASPVSSQCDGLLDRGGSESPEVLRPLALTHDNAEQQLQLVCHLEIDDLRAQ